jgi:hypothetical protein
MYFIIRAVLIHFMKPSVFALLLAFILLFRLSFAQTHRQYLKFYDHHYTLAANKSGQLAIASQEGEVAIGSTVNNCWNKTYLDKTIDGPNTWKKINNICYFNTDTAFISGRIYDDEGRAKEIYHTIDGGKSWQPIKFGFEGAVYVDDAAFLNNGEAWLSVADRGLTYTKDYGFTWSRLAFPPDTGERKQRFSKIYFNSKRAGIIGSERDALAYTNDNCQHWTIIPTPYNQGKYKNSSTHDEGLAINRVAIFKNYLLVKQGDRIFYSNLHKVQWISLPEYCDFYTDAENSALFFIRNNSGFVKCDSELHPVLSIDSICKPFGITCRNGCLYVLGIDKYWQINTNNQLIENPLYTNDTMAISEPVKFGDHFIYYSQSIGHIGKMIYTKRNYKWEYAFTLPFATDGGFLSEINSDIILFTRGDSVFNYSIPGKKLSKVNAANEMRDFSAGGIQKIIFTKGFGNCARVGEENMIYTLKDNQFVLTQRYTRNSGGDDFLRDYPNTIDQYKVAGFVQKLPAIHSKRVQLDELGLTREDYDSCKRSILIIKSLLEAGENEEYSYVWERENQDFTKLITLVDSVKSSDPELLNRYFLAQESFSTIHNWFVIKLVNNKGQELEIKNDRFYSDGFYCPWQINLNNSHTISTATEIRQFVNDVYPDFLPRQDQKVALIQRLVKLLYHQWAEDE